MVFFCKCFVFNLDLGDLVASPFLLWQAYVVGQCIYRERERRDEEIHSLNIHSIIDMKVFI